jgi:hypothetical protein
MRRDGLAHLLVLPLLLSACAELDAGDETIEELGDLAPPIGAAYALRLDAHFQNCRRDVADDDRDGVKDECDERGINTDDAQVVALWRPTQTIDAVAGPLQICAASLSAAGHDLTVDPAFLRAAAPVDLRGAIAAIDGVPGLVGEPAALVMGATLADPFEDALPPAGDPRIVDQDKDGKPGFTLKPSIGKVFGSVRVIFRLQGALDAAGAIAGGAEVTLDKAIYDDTVPFVDVAKKAAEAQARNIRMGGKHGFVLIPLATPTCDAAVAAR